MINSMYRRTALAAALVALSLPASAGGDEALSSALGAMHAPMAVMAQLKARYSVPGAIKVQYTPVQAGDGRVTLSCRNNDGSNTHTYRINYATGLFEELNPYGNAYTNRIAPDARVSGNAIIWSVRLMDTGLETPVPSLWEGTIDRLSGTGWAQFSREPNWHVYRETFTCFEVKGPKF